MEFYNKKNWFKSFNASEPLGIVQITSPFLVRWYTWGHIGCDQALSLRMRPRGKLHEGVGVGTRKEEGEGKGREDSQVTKDYSCHSAPLQLSCHWSFIWLSIPTWINYHKIRWHPSSSCPHREAGFWSSEVWASYVWHWPCFYQLN